VSSSLSASSGQPVSTHRFVRTGDRGLTNPVSEFSALLNTVRDAGLLRRRRRFYIITFAVITLAMVAAWVGFGLLHETWYTLIIAAALGILFTQYAFLAHEASHRQVFESGKANDYSGRMLADLFVGISYSWWMSKHTRHHANPNTIGKDPDIEADFIIFQAEDAVGLRGIQRFFTRRQGWFFFVAILAEGLNLHIQAFKTVFSRGKVDKRALEIVLLSVRNLTYLAVVFYFLPLGMAFAFVGVQLAIFGLYMGASFVPNHTGMPFLPRDSRVDFLRRQVLTSRNIRGGWFMNIFMGGLNYQIEHHLFPSMPRPHLRRAGEIVKEYCESRDVLYTETSLPQAYGIVTRYLNRVGLGGAVMPGDCPVAASYGR
jgi:fatty acid desaturase